MTHERTTPDPARSGVRLGAIAGAVVLLVSLVGMVEAFTERAIIADGLNLGQITWWGVVFIYGWIAADRQTARGMERPPSGAALRSGSMAGLSAGAIVGLFVTVGSQIDLSVVFDKARPALYELLTIGWVTPSLLESIGWIGMLSGPAWVPVVICTAAGLAGSALHLVQPRLRGAIVTGVVSLVVMGIIRDLLGKLTFIQQIDVLSAAFDMLYTRSGLTMIGATVVVASSAGFKWAWPELQRAARRPFDDLSEADARRTRRTLRFAGLFAAAVLLIWYPFGFGTYAADVFDLVGIYILMGLGLNIVVGFAGLLDLGYVAFFAIGAYSVGILTSGDATANLQIGWTFWEALPVAIVLTIISGILLGVPVLKTHGDYLAIITLGFGEIIRILAISDVLEPVMGGAQGVTLIPEPYQLGEIVVPGIGLLDPGKQQELYFPILVAVVIATYVSWRLRHSRFGRAWMAIREDEHVAEAMGINLVATKLLAFATGAAFAGVGGALFAAKLGSIYPSSFNLLVSINVLVLIIVGGMGSIPGVFVGALALVGLPELLREFQDFRLLLYGAVLVVMMLKRPEGLWPAAIVQRELHGHPERNEPPAAAADPVPDRGDEE